MDHPFKSTLDRNRELMRNSDGLPPLRAIPDDELIANLVVYGQPRWAAEELRGNPQLRLAATQFLFDCEDAARGDKAAKQKVDFLREQWVRARQAELISDDPRRFFDDVIVDPRDLL